MKSCKDLVLFSMVLLANYGGFAQQKEYGSIEVYGNRKISTIEILSHINIEIRDSINANRSISEPEGWVNELQSLPGVKNVKIAAVCCDPDNALIVYVGISENDTLTFKYRPSPNQNLRLSPKIFESYNQFNEQLKIAVQKGELSEDYENGYSLLTYLPARREQLKFVEIADQRFPELVEIILHSKHEEHRAAAAQIIAYSSNKNEVAKYLLFALNDADEGVRNNAARALSILAGFLSEHPDLDVFLPAAPFIDMLNSISWTDRNKASMVLIHLSQTRDPSLLKEIKKEAMTSIVEMAQWKNRQHALFSFMILGRIAGEDENFLIQANFSDDWPEVVKRMIQKCCSE